MAAPRKYPEELRERATRMAVDLRRDPATRSGALRRVGEQLGSTRRPFGTGFSTSRSTKVAGGESAATHIRIDTDGRAYYRRKIAAGKSRREAMRCLKGASPPLSAISAQTPPRAWTRPGRAQRCDTSVQRDEAQTRTPALRISHFPNPHQRRYPRATTTRKTTITRVLEPAP